MTQQALASVSDVDRSFIARIETGKHQPSLTVIFGLARGLSMPPQELIAATDSFFLGAIGEENAGR
jgi:transcriptional regulator with XRE-family HTH domain